MMAASRKFTDRHRARAWLLNLDIGQVDRTRPRELPRIR